MAKTLETTATWLVSEGLECGEQGLTISPGTMPGTAGQPISAMIFLNGTTSPSSARTRRQAMTSRSSGVRWRRDFQPSLGVRSCPSSLRGTTK